MKTALFLIAFVLFAKSNSWAQRRTVEITVNKNRRGGYEFYGFNNSCVTNVIHLYFTKFENLYCSEKLPYDAELKPGNNYLFEINPENSSYSTIYYYKYQTFDGRLKSEIDINYPYLLTIAEGKTTQVEYFRHITNLEDFRTVKDSNSRRNINMENFKLVPNRVLHFDSGLINKRIFKLSYGDTIFAARRGIVFRTYLYTKLKDNKDSTFAIIKVFHNDGSIATYQGIHNVLVVDGQTIDAGEPIAFAGQNENMSKVSVFFSVEYFDENNKNKYDSGNMHISSYVNYINPMFYTKEGGVYFLVEDKTYTSVHLEEIITKEMTKKELKRWKKRHL